MKKIFAALALCLVLLAAPAARAQVSLPDSILTAKDADVLLPQEQSRPPQTSARKVAMLAYKIAAKAPNLAAWAAQSEEAKAASSFERQAVIERDVAALRHDFNLLSTREPVVAHLSAVLSPYSFENKGFLIESFFDDTYFPIDFVGDHFALVPVKLLESQWVAVEGDAARAIEEAAEKHGRKVELVLYLTPVSANVSTPAAIDDVPRKLIAAEVSNIALYAVDGVKPLWEKGEAAAEASDNTRRDQLRGLFRK